MHYASRSLIALRATPGVGLVTPDVFTWHLQLASKQKAYREVNVTMLAYPKLSLLIHKLLGFDGRP